MSDGLRLGEDGQVRCSWGSSTPDHAVYHDAEWGFPVADDRRLFEKICLEGFQSGLSWLTILRKREAFRTAFAGFAPDVVAGFDELDIARLLADAGIVRHRGKIVSTINNARCFLEVADERGSFAAYVWSFEPGEVVAPSLRATSPESTALARDMKRRGFTFVGPTTVYAFMQAMGLVNDHLEGCCVRSASVAARTAFVVPA